MSHDRPVKAQLTALLARLRALTDAEQWALHHWFATGERTELYRIGISDDEVGPAPVFESDAVSDHHVRSLPRLPDLQKALSLFRIADPSVREAIQDWFVWRDRAALIALGATFVEIGPTRLVPDDVWPDEDSYSAVYDGTLQYIPLGGSRFRARLRIGDVWLDD